MKKTLLMSNFSIVTAAVFNHSFFFSLNIKHTSKANPLTHFVLFYLYYPMSCTLTFNYSKHSALSRCWQSSIVIKMKFVQALSCSMVLCSFMKIFSAWGTEGHATKKNTQNASTGTSHKMGVNPCFGGRKERTRLNNCYLISTRVFPTPLNVCLIAGIRQAIGQMHTEWKIRQSRM